MQSQTHIPKSLEKQVKLKQEFKEWDKLSDEALANFEKKIQKKLLEPNRLEE